MKVTPIAADSLGTRSMATLVKTHDCSILIDPSAALGPVRYRLSPHPLELQKLDEHWSKIKEHAQKSDILIVTHYHYDHHNPDAPEIYEGKTVFLKHPMKKINKSQMGRAKLFLERLGELPEVIHFSDGGEFSFGKTKIRFSKPVFHGTSNKLGYVTEVSIKEKGKCFVFTSDVEGPSINNQAKFIIDENPDIVYLDGPITYMLGYRYSKASLLQSIRNILLIFEKTKIEKLIVDHHFLRDIRWGNRMGEVYTAAEKHDVKVMTAAEYLGLENVMLEARRKELYDG
jgi:predicted metallo-beta-lactamase superfamily hydrolase